MLGRKDLFKNTLRKAAYAMKRIIELRLSGDLYSFFSLSLVSILLISSMGGCLILFFFLLFIAQRRKLLCLDPLWMSLLL